MRSVDGKSIMQTTKRPVFLSLHQTHLPLTGFVSIAHRLTGVLLFLLLPLLLYLLQHSLASEAAFDEVRQWLHSWPWRLLLLLLIWWFAHHLFAGLRFLLMDFDIGVQLPQARLGATLVLLAAAVVVLAVIVGML